MRAAGVGPGEREGFLVLGSSLEKELVLGVEEEDAEGTMGHGVGFGEVFVGVGSPLVDGGKEVIGEGDWDKLVE